MVFVSVGHISPSIILSTSIHGVTDGKLSLFLWQNNIPLYPPRARQLGMWSQGGLRKHHYKQASRGDGISVELFQILKDGAVESAAFNMPANLENSTVVTGLEKVSFHSNPKERQCQRMLKLPHNCTHLTCKQSNVQNSPSQASAVCEPWTSWCSSWF